MIEQYTSPAVVNNSQEPWLVGEGVSLSGSIAIPSLDFNFVTNAFPGTVTFSRASSATMFDSSGMLVYAPMNLLTYSEQFDNAAWLKAGLNTTGAPAWVNVEVAPDGTTTADKIIEDTANTAHFISRNQGVTVGTSYAFTIYAKAAERSFFRLQSFNASGDAENAVFDLATGTIFSQSGTSASTITPVGNGWYRCSVIVINDTDTSSALSIQLFSDGTTSSYTGDGTSGLYIWGAQFNQTPMQGGVTGDLSTYYPTTVKNLLGYTQEFDNAAWAKSNTTVTANATTDPQGYVTADKLVESGSGSISHYVGQGVITTIVGTKYTLSYYAKADERNWIQLSGASAQFGSSQWANFDLVNGVVGNKGTTQENETITALGNGWYRCSITITATVASSTTTGYLLVLRVNSASRFPAYEAEAGKGVFIWGAQLSDSASLDQYVYNPGAAPAAAAYQGPRLDYDPATLAARGLLIEEQRTNGIRNNTMQGAVAGVIGSGGAAPTNWTIASSASGLTREIIGTGTENGITYIDLKVSGTSTSSGTIQITPETTTGVAALTGQTWTGASYLKLVGGSFPSTVAWIWIERDSGGGIVVTASAVPFGPPDGSALNTQRYSNTRTLSGGASVAYVTLRLDVTIPNSTVIDFTLRIGLPQLELGAFATSVIPTTTTALTRSADVASVNTLSPWYNQTEGAVYAELQSLSPLTAAQSVALSKYPNVWQINAGATDSVAFWYGVVSELLIGGTYNNIGAVPSGINKFAVSLAPTAGQSRSSLNGAAAVNRNGTLTGTATLLSLGKDSTNGPNNFLNGYLRRLTYYPRALSAAELQALTA